jgi:hypothetical protein
MGTRTPTIPKTYPDLSNDEKNDVWSDFREINLLRKTSHGAEGVCHLPNQLKEVGMHETPPRSYHAQSYCTPAYYRTVEPWTRKPRRAF